MKRKVIIFGNGLGRSLNPEKYDLGVALNKVWNEGGLLSDEEKQLIHQCLPNSLFEESIDSPPQKEDDLDSLQRIVKACDEILSYQKCSGPESLTQHGKQFPTAIRRYIHGVACSFYEGDDKLPSYFVKLLIAHILNSRSHVATLNYDELLYRSFVKTDIFSGYSCPVDGFISGVFSDTNLRRSRRDCQSYYLHLHGSPLYLTDNKGYARKFPLRQVSSLKGTSSLHLVLTHIAHKKDVISASEILASYWNRLAEAMDDVDCVLLFGYGGAMHISMSSLQRNFWQNVNQF